MNSTVNTMDNKSCVFLQLSSNNVSLFPNLCRLTLKFWMICLFDSRRNFWQAPILQKQPVRMWISCSWTSLSTCRENRKRI